MFARSVLRPVLSSARRAVAATINSRQTHTSNVPDLRLVNPRVYVASLWLPGCDPISLTEQNLACAEASTALLHAERKPRSVHPIMELDGFPVRKDRFCDLHSRHVGSGINISFQLQLGYTDCNLKVRYGILQRDSESTGTLRRDIAHLIASLSSRDVTAFTNKAV